MAQGLNVIPIGNISNPMLQQFAQSLRNGQVFRNTFKSSLAVFVRAVQATGGSSTDLAAILGLTAAQAQIVHDEAASFGAQLDSIDAAWTQINAIMGISV